MDSRREIKDRLSSLPDSVIVHILSFLPTSEAVRTMLIKKSFSSLWTLLPSLDLEDWSFDYWDDRNYDDDDDDDDSGSLVCDLPFFVFVRNLLKHHKKPKIDKFRVNITDMFYSDIEDRNLGHELESWINFALRKQVETLEFIFGMVEPDELLFKWPSELISNSLVELRLEFLDMNSLTRVQLGSLRILRLIRVEVKDSLLGEIICGCPLLNELEIYNCYDVNELSFAAPNVEKVIVDISEFSFYSDEDDDFGPLLKINCPNLKSLDFTGFADCLEIINLSSLVDVTFNLRCRRLEFKEFPKFRTVLKTLVCAERVSFSYEFVTVLFYCLLKDAPQSSSINWKSANFRIWLTEKHIHGLNCMLRNSPHLEELVMNITSWQGDFVKPIEAQFEDDVLDREDCWKSLKSITIHNIVNSSYPVLLRLTELLLEKASVLNELVFYYGGRKDRLPEETCNLTLEELAEFTQKLPTLSKASRHVKFSCVN